MLKGFKGLPQVQLSAPPRAGLNRPHRCEPTGYDKPDTSAGSHASLHPRGLKLPKGALSSVLFGISAPAELRVLVKWTHVESLLLLPRGYGLRYCLPTLPTAAPPLGRKGRQPTLAPDRAADLGPLAAPRGAREAPNQLRPGYAGVPFRVARIAGRYAESSGQPSCAPQAACEPQDRPSNQIKLNQIPLTHPHMGQVWAV